MSYLNTFKKYWYIVAAIVAVVTILSLIVSVVQTPEYKSSVKLLVIHKQGDSVDAYTATRSAETVAKILSNVIYTSTFFDQVMSAGFEIEKNTYSTDPEDRRKEWERAVDTRVIEENGTLQIDVFDESREQAEQLAYAIAYVIINNGKQYHGAATQIETKMIDAPITSDNVARPNTLMNVAAGLALGLLTSLAIIFLLSERKLPEKYTAGLEVKTMPKIKERKKAKKSFPIKESTIRKTEEKEEVSSSRVKENIAKELKDFSHKEELQKKDIKDIKPVQTKTMPKITKDIQEKEIKGRMSAGMDKLGSEKAAPKPKADQIVYTPEDIQENYKKQEDDKYSPEKVEKWIKTGKFE